MRERLLSYLMLLGALLLALIPCAGLERAVVMPAIVFAAAAFLVVLGTAGRLLASGGK